MAVYRQGLPRPVLPDLGYGGNAPYAVVVTTAGRHAEGGYDARGGCC
jgi:hypothetical protein